MAKKAPKGAKGKGGGDKQKEKKPKADVTFGMKNKKGRRAQGVAKGQSIGKKGDKAAGEAKFKKLQKQRQADEAALFDAPKTLNTSSGQGMGGGPTMVMCEFFKQGNCKKGKKCKFLHDWSQVRKTQKIDVYTDPRVEKGCAPEKDAGVCKHFLDAVEKQQYGYFWTCPGGGEECQYAHCLPPGYVVLTEKEKKQMEENTEEETGLEDVLDDLLTALAGRTDLIPVTLATFRAWKKNKKKKEVEERRAKAKSAVNAPTGKNARILSGRDLFAYDESLFADDEAADEETYLNGVGGEKKEDFGRKWDHFEETDDIEPPDDTDEKTTSASQNTTPVDEIATSASQETTPVDEVTTAVDEIAALSVEDESLFLDDLPDEDDLSDGEG
eukprot:46193_1